MSFKEGKFLTHGTQGHSFMKILVLSDYIENYAEPNSFRIRYLSAYKMAEKGHDVVFMSPSNKLMTTTSKIINDRLKTVTTPGLFSNRLRTGGFGILDALYKTRIALQHDFDIIQATNGHRPAQFIPCLIGKYLKKAVIVDECWEWLGKGGYADNRKGVMGKIVSFYDRRFELPFKGFYDQIITISTVLKNRFSKKHNVTVLHGGTENSKLEEYDIYGARKEVNLDSNSFIVGISNVIPADHEDNHIFFKAFERLCQEYSNVFLVATGSDKYYIDEIKRTYFFSDRIIFTGWVAFDVYNKYLSSCNIFVLPYRNNPINAGRWPNKIGDYLCLNRPIITNPTGDIKALFQRYKVGLLCDETPEGFYDTLRKMLNKEIDLNLYTRDSLYVANEILSFDKRIDKFLDIFEETAKKVKPQV
ncbi:MAG: glycosyltransferase family 4 protein [Gammaproteobacteria bacterium]|nr:glycosyltransferase family 4 protein [Gammaproteobacteria bacterium]